MKDLKTIENIIEKFHYENNLLFWKYSTGELENDVYKEKCKIQNKEENEFFNDKEINKFLFNLWNSKNTKRKKEMREISLLYRYYVYEFINNNPLLRELISEATTIIKNNLFTLDGKEVTEKELRKEIENSKSIEEIRKKEYVFTQMQKYNKLALDIVNLRNSLAREKGFSSFFEVYLFRYELDNKYVVKICSLYIDSLKKYIKKIDRKKRENEFWKMNQEIEKRLKKEDAIITLRKLINKWGVKQDKNVKVLVDKEGKSNFPWNYCIPILIPNDVRIYLYPDKSISSYYYSLFHEFGHALHYSNINEKKFIFKLNPPWYDEAMAALVDKFLSLDESVSYFVKDSEVKEIVKGLSQSEDYISYAHRITEFEFEMNLYSGKEWEEENLNKFQKNIYWKNLKIEKKVPDWAHFILHSSEEPLYGISYLLANTIANRIISHIYKKYGKYLLPQSYAFLKENFLKKGNSEKWKEKMKIVDGNPLDISYFWGVQNS